MGISGVINVAMTVGLLALLGGLIWWRRGRSAHTDRRPRRALRVVLTVSASIAALAACAYVWFLIQLQNVVSWPTRPAPPSKEVPAWTGSW